MNDTTVRHLTTEQAVKFLKATKNGERFALSVRSDAVIVDDQGKATNQVFQDGLSGYLPLSKREAVSLAGHMLSKTLEGRGARITISTTHGEITGLCHWIGG